MNKIGSFILNIAGMVLCVGLVGCRTNDQIKSTEEEEKVVLAMVSPEEFTEDFVSLPRGALVGVATDILIEVGSYLFSREADLVGGAYEAQVRNPVGVVLREFEDHAGNTFFIRDLNKTLILDRYVGNHRAMSLVVDFVPFFPENSTRSYFQIQPRSLRCDISRAESAKSLLSRTIQYKKISFVVLVSIQFPDSKQPNGLANYSHIFEIKDYEIGDMMVLRDDKQPNDFKSDFFEVPSDGPMTVVINVVESNSLSRALDFLAEEIDDL